MKTEMKENRVPIQEKEIMLMELVTVFIMATLSTRQHLLVFSPDNSRM